MPRHHAYRAMLGHSPVGRWAIAAVQRDAEPGPAEQALDDPAAAAGERPAERRTPPAAAR